MQYLQYINTSYRASVYSVKLLFGAIFKVLNVHSSTVWVRLLFLSFGMCVSAQAETLQQRYVMRGASLGLPGAALDCT